MTEDERYQAIRFSMNVTVPDHVLAQALDGESVLLNLGTGLYLGLNRSGTNILSVLAESESIQHAYETLLAQYEIEPNRFRTELLEFLEKLRAEGIVEISAR